MTNTTAMKKYWTLTKGSGENNTIKYSCLPTAIRSQRQKKRGGEGEWVGWQQNRRKDDNFFSINLRPVGSLNPLQQARGRDKENALGITYEWTNKPSNT